MISIFLNCCNIIKQKVNNFASKQKQVLFIYLHYIYFGLILLRDKQKAMHVVVILYLLSRVANTRGF